MNQNQPLIITISRQLGSGGAYIGQQLAKKLGINYADQEIISQMAKQLSVLKSELELRDEKTQSLWDAFLQHSAYAPEVYIPTTQVRGLTDYDLFRAQTGVMEQIAQKSSSVLIGRCGFYILRNFPNRVSLFLHADHSFRSKRIQSLYGVSEKVAGEMIKKSDKDRSRYVNEFSKANWSDANQYDLSIDTGKIGIDNTVNFILNYLSLR